jgi:hypothetical protein
MAAEYSRELSTKVFAGQCRIVSLGFWHGGPPTYGLRRELVDEHGRPRGFLAPGERKYLQTDRVLLRPGAPQEVELVRHVFHQFAIAREREAKIARELNLRGITNQHGRPWRTRVVRNLLRNENYIGINVYNRSSERLGQKKKANPLNVWIRSALNDFEPVVEPSLFWRANETFVKRARILISNDEMLDRLASLLKKTGRLSARIISKAEGVPCTRVYIARFGSLRRAYQLIGYHPKDNLRYIYARRSSTAALCKVAADIAIKFQTAGATADFHEDTNVLTIENRLVISLVIARCFRVKNRWPRWTFFRRGNSGENLIIAARMDEANANILDYFLLPSDKFKGKRKVDLTETSCTSLEPYRVATVDALVHSIFNALAHHRDRR